MVMKICCYFSEAKHVNVTDAIVEENTTNSSWTLTNGNARCNVLHKRADVGVRGDVTFIWYRSRAFLSNADLVHVNSSYNIF